MLLRSGDRVLIRPIRPEDKAGLQKGLHQLTPDSRYRRFFSPLPELSARQLRYLTEVDHHTHKALVAIDLDSGDGIGVARFVRSTTDLTAAEAAVAVGDKWHGHGVGTALLMALAAHAREEGVERFTASVLAGNSACLELVRKLSDTAVIDGTGTEAEVQVKLRRRGIATALSHAIRLTAGGEVEVDPRHPAAPSQLRERSTDSSYRVRIGSGESALHLLSGRPGPWLADAQHHSRVSSGSKVAG